MILYNVHAKCVGNGPVWPSFWDVLLNLCVFSIYFPDAQQSSCVLCVFLSAMDSHEIGRTCMHKSSLLLLLLLKFMTILSCDSSVHVISKESCTQPEYMFERRSFHTQLTYIVFLHESKSTLWNQTCMCDKSCCSKNGHRLASLLWLTLDFLEVTCTPVHKTTPVHQIHHWEGLSIEFTSYSVFMLSLWASFHIVWAQSFIWQRGLSLSAILLWYVVGKGRVSGAWNDVVLLAVKLGESVWGCRRIWGRLLYCWCNYSAVLRPWELQWHVR